MVGVFSFVRNCRAVFRSGCTILRPHQRWVSVPGAPRARQNVVVSVFPISVCGVILLLQFFCLANSYILFRSRFSSPQEILSEVGLRFSSVFSPLCSPWSEFWYSIEVISCISHFPMRLLKGKDHLSFQSWETVLCLAWMGCSVNVRWTEMINSTWNSFFQEERDSETKCEPFVV